MNGDISNLSPVFATLYAIVSKAQTYQFKDDRSELEFESSQQQTPS
jgi:hypothetical protein